MSSVGLILLAAGGSSRLGEPKQLLRMNGQTLLHHAAETAIQSICRPIVVVLGARHEEMLTELDGLELHTILNPEWERGIGGSIRSGVQLLAANSNVDAALIALCDQPFLTSAHLDALVARFREQGPLVVASGYGGGCGVPALFHRSLFSDLMRLSDSEGAKRVINEHPSRLVTVPFPGGALDIDTPNDRDRLIQGVKLS